MTICGITSVMRRSSCSSCRIFSSASFAAVTSVVAPKNSRSPDEVVSACALTTSSGDLEFLGATTDVTAAKEAEEKNRQDEPELRRITDVIPQMVIVYSPEGRAVYVNRVALEYTGLSIEEMLTESFRAHVIHPDDVERFRIVRQNGLPTGVPFETEQRILGKDGKYRWFLSRYNPLKDEQGRLIRWYATATDIDG